MVAKNRLKSFLKWSNIQQFEYELKPYNVTVDLTNYKMRGRMLLNSDMSYSYLFANLKIQIYNKYTAKNGGQTGISHINTI